MPKFFLHGGHPGYDYYFWREVTDNFAKKRLKVTTIPFAMGTCDWSENGDPDIQARLMRAYESSRQQAARILQWMRPDKQIVIVHEIAEADIIYVDGGNGDVLQEEMARVYPNLNKVIAGNKVFAGNSAGANLWSAKYYSNDNGAVMDGFGILPIKTFCHWNSEKCEQLNELIQTAPDLPVYPLTNDGWVQFEI